MINYQTLLFLVIMLIISTSTSAQVVNIESRRMQTDSTRFALRSALSANYNNNNYTEVYQLNANITTQAKTKDLRSIFFVLGSYSLINSGNQNLVNNWFTHLRYNYKLHPVLRLEAFFQNQNNQLLEVVNRTLFATGIRFKLISSDKFNLYLGNSFMYEIEQSSGLPSQCVALPKNNTNLKLTKFELL